MKRQFPIAIALTAILLPVGWGTGTQKKPALLAAAAEAIPPARAATGGYRLVEVRGEVQLMRAGERNSRPVTANMELYPGDLLKVARGATATVLCATNGQTWTLPAGLSGVTNGCPPENPINPQLPPTRGSVDKNSPYIISPRQTALLNSWPKLRWNDLRTESGYIVLVRGEDGTRWEKTVTASEITYSGSPLKPGVTYQLIVQSGSGEGESQDYATFWLLDEQTARAVRDRAAALGQQPWSEEEKALATADLYRAHSLIAEAIETLEALKGKTEAVKRMLGELYEWVGLAPQAQRHYSQGIWQKASGIKPARTGP
ncbi:hypothetical protein [Kamptonema formosum]|uniref:hypothetical protein n=1 Tax=Kamptonema formosum TaxID=331992 RepID=UPI00034587BF|nr:hypothetical protein [Oscillatoria sp. PCC 10802]